MPTYSSFNQTKSDVPWETNLIETGGDSSGGPKKVESGVTFGLKPRTRGLFYLPMETKLNKELAIRMVRDGFVCLGLDRIDDVLYRRWEKKKTRDKIVNQEVQEEGT